MNRQTGTAVMAGLLALAAALFVLLPARVLECDAVIYACAGLHLDLVQSTDAGHLAWGGLELLAARLGRAWQPPLNPLYLLRWLSVVAGLGTAWLLYRLLTRRLRLATLPSALLAGCLLFSYAHWHFALQGEPHALHTLSLTAFLLTAWRLYERPGARTALLAGACLGLATLLHQTTILLVPVALIALVPAIRGNASLRLRTAGWFLTAYLPVAIGSYLVVGGFVRGLRSYAEWHDWIMGISVWGGWGYWQLTRPVAALVGVVRSLTGSHYLLGIEPVADLARRLFPSASWEDELLLAGAVPGWLRLALVPLQAAVLVGAGWLLLRSLRRVRSAWSTAPAFAGLLVGWLAVHTLFFTWWAPERAEFWVAFWLPMAVLVAGVWRELRISAGWLALGLACLVTVNLGGSIASQSLGRLEPATLIVVAVDPVVTEGDILLSDLPLARRAGGYVYAVDKVTLPTSPARMAAVADSLLAVAETRDRRLYWVGEGISLPAGLRGTVQAGPAVPIRAPAKLLPLYPVAAADP